MSETLPAPQPLPSSSPERRSPPAIALVLAGALAGGVAGGLVGATVAQRAEAPQVSALLASPGVGATQQITVSESSAAVDAVKEILPAVVTVVNKSANGQPISSGSGVVIDRSRGYVVTNSHVVEQPRSFQPSKNFDVILFDGTKLSATAVGNDPETDVAVLKVQGSLPAQATLADSSQLPLGAQLVAIGSPGVPGLGTGNTLPILQNSVTSGVVSAKGRRLAREDIRDVFLEDLIQTDAAINPGNSGGPLVWVATKQVVGLNTLVVRGSGEEGLGFAISSATVRKIADELITQGKVQRGFVGIQYDENNARYNAYYNLGTSVGVVILAVQPGTPAAGAGLRPRDVIVKVNNQAVDEAHPLKTVLLNTRPGDRVTLTIVRDGREQTMSLTLGSPTSEIGLV